MTKPHKKRLIAVVILFVVCAGTLIVLDKKFTSPTKAVSATSPSVAYKAASLDLVPQNHKDAFVSFDYPSIMTINQPQQFALPLVDSVSLAYPDLQSWVLTVIVYKIPSGSLNDNSAYLTRARTPTVYQLSKSTINGASIPIFSDVTSGFYNKVAFLINGEYQATVALSGNDASGLTPLAKTMNMVLSSWKWQVGG